MSFRNDQVSEGETTKIVELAQKCLGVEGDYVEFGCYKGDTSLLLAEVLRSGVVPVEKSVEKGVEELGKSGGKPVKRLWIYDSFEGLPEKTEADESVTGGTAGAGD